MNKKKFQKLKGLGGGAEGAGVWVFSTCTYKSDHISTVTSPGPLHLVLL